MLTLENPNYTLVLGLTPTYITYIALSVFDITCLRHAKTASMGVTGVRVRYVCLKKHSVFSADTSRIHDPDFMADVVFSRVPKMRLYFCVDFPCVSLARYNMHFLCTSYWGKWISIAIVHSIHILKTRLDWVHP